jgi:hypothetical protein
MIQFKITNTFKSIWKRIKTWPIISTIVILLTGILTYIGIKSILFWAAIELGTHMVFADIPIIELLISGIIATGLILIGIKTLPMGIFIGAVGMILAVTEFLQKQENRMAYEKHMGTD